MRRFSDPVLATAILAVILVLMVWAALALWPGLVEWRPLLERLEALGPWLWLALVALMILHNVVPIPAELIAVSAGATLGLGAGIVAIWVGAMLGAALAFWVARRFGRPLMRHHTQGAALRRLDRFVAAGDWRGLLAVRLLPVVSFNLVNYAAGLAGVGWGRFLWTTAIGILPVTVLSVAVGTGLHLAGALPALAILAAALLVWLLVGRARHG